MAWITALTVLVLARRTFMYGLLRASLSPCTPRHLTALQARMNRRITW